MSQVVSVRVPREVKEALERAGIDVSRTTKEYLEMLAWEARAKETLGDLHEMIEKNVKPAPRGSAARLVRRDRNAHH